MSDLLITRKTWVESQRARQDATKLRTAKEWSVLEAAKKVQRSADREIGSLKKDMRIMKALQKWERESEQSGATMLILTPLDGKSPQLPIVLDGDREGNLSNIGNFFRKLNEIQAKYAGSGFQVAPSSKYQVDIYIAGENITMAHRAFAQVSRKALEHSTLFFNLACDLKDLHLPIGASYQPLPELDENDLAPLLARLESAAN